MASNVEQTRIFGHQLTLFPRKPREVCQEIGLNWLAAQQLFEWELLSFNPMDVEKLSEGQETELRFLGALVIGGCDRGMIEYLIRDLKRPYYYCLDRIFYHWPTQQWQTFPEIENIDELDNEQAFSDWVDELAENGDREQLVAIEKTIHEAIDRIEGTIRK